MNHENVCELSKLIQCIVIIIQDLWNIATQCMPPGTTINSLGYLVVCKVWIKEENILIILAMFFFNYLFYFKFVELTYWIDVFHFAVNIATPTTVRCGVPLLDDSFDMGNHQFILTSCRSHYPRRNIKVRSFFLIHGRIGLQYDKTFHLYWHKRILVNKKITGSSSELKLHNAKKNIDYNQSPRDAREH